MSKETWVPDDFLADKPNAARIYDYLLGGFHNFEIDRQAAKYLLEFYPDARLGSQACRAFLRRVVNFLTEQGIGQFLDIGSGLPTVGNVHETAQRANPAARVVYVDIDPVAVAHARALLKDNPNATAIRADARWPEKILNDPEVKGLLDFSQPVGVLLLLILHAITDDEEAYRAVRVLHDALAPGSYMAISHGTYDNVPPELVKKSEELTARTPTPSRHRSRAEIRRFFEGLEVVEPGLVYMPLWRPEEPDDLFLDQPERPMIFCGVGRKKT
jgi:SAM-dependent methyltransferase